MRRYYLKTGDTCPCCGQPISTDDPAKLELLTDIAKSADLSAKAWLEAIGFEWPKEG